VSAVHAAPTGAAGAHVFDAPLHVSPGAHVSSPAARHAPPCPTTAAQVPVLLNFEHTAPDAHAPVHGWPTAGSAVHDATPASSSVQA
jgi:hypothetical protein